MEVDKPPAKGGLFQFFDWNAKSREKLFSSKSEISESSNEGIENIHGSHISRFQQEVKNGCAPNARSNNNFRYASSASCDSEYGARGPGVVARLMGLDSLPTSNVMEPCFDPLIESHSFRDSNCLRAPPAFQNEHDIVMFESVRNKLDGLTMSPLDLKLQKVQSRLVKRFQTELLPPKFTKPISVTQHSLLSPIKSPGFIPPKNAPYKLEAAAKLIEQSPQSTIKVKLPSLGSSSGPFKFQDLKEKTDSSHKLFQPGDVSQKGKAYNFAKHKEKQLSATGQKRDKDSLLYQDYEESKVLGSQRLKSKEKSVSLSFQVKVNNEKRDKLSSVGSRSSQRQKEYSDVKTNLVSKNQWNMQNRMENRSSFRKPSEVLTMNHQKQNCASAREGEKHEPSVSHPKDGIYSNFSVSRVHPQQKRNVNKIVVDHVVSSRKTNAVATELGITVSSLRTKTSSKKKVPINWQMQSEGSVAQKVMVMKDEKSFECNAEIGGNTKLDASDKKNSLDVLSFTFTSPIKNSKSGSNSRGFNITGGEALSVILEQKLKELTSGVESSQQYQTEASFFFSFANNYGENLRKRAPS